MSIRFCAVGNLWSHVKMRIEKKSKNWPIACLIVFNECAVTQRRRMMEKWAYVTFFSMIWRFERSFDEYYRSYIRGGDTFASCVCLLHQGAPIRVGRTRPRWWNPFGNCLLTLNFDTEFEKHGCEGSPSVSEVKIFESWRKIAFSRFCS